VTPLLYVAGGAALLLLLKPGIASALVAGVVPPAKPEDLVPRLAGQPVSAASASELAMLKAYAAQLISTRGGTGAGSATVFLVPMSATQPSGSANRSHISGGEAIVGYAGDQPGFSLGILVTNNPAWSDPAAIFYRQHVVSKHGGTILQRAIDLAAPVVKQATGGGFGLPF